MSMYCRKVCKCIYVIVKFRRICMSIMVVPSPWKMFLNRFYIHISYSYLKHTLITMNLPKFNVNHLELKTLVLFWAQFENLDDLIFMIFKLLTCFAAIKIRSQPLVLTLKYWKICFVFWKTVFLQAAFDNNSFHVSETSRPLKMS